MPTGALGVLRVIRVLRIFKLTRNNQTIRDFLTAMYAVPHFSFVCVMLLLLSGVVFVLIVVVVMVKTMVTSPR